MDDNKLLFIDHIKELRKRLILSVVSIVLFAVAAFFFFDVIISFLFQPLKQLSTENGSEVLFINSLSEGFSTKLEISFLAGIVFTIPVHLFNIIRFILPGLKKGEKKVLFISLTISSVFLVSAFFYGYGYIIPISINFLAGKGFFPTGVGMLLSYKKNIYFILHLILASLLVFQIPILLELLLMMNVVKRRTLLGFSRYIIVAIFVISAIFTPPDFISQLFIALPLTLLYFLTLVIAKIFNFGKDDLCLE